MRASSSFTPPAPVVTSVLLLVCLALWPLASGCASREAPAAPPEVPAFADEAYLQGSVWNDGQAEIAFYQVERTHNQYNQPLETPQTFMAGTYVVKHDFDPQAQSKATANAAERVETFKSAFFYEFESGSYQYKRNYVVNIGRADLRTYKASFTSFDWCSNLYEELAFQPDGTVDAWMRSDDYGNTTATHTDVPRQAVPVAALPMVVRGLDFTEQSTHTLTLVQQDGSTLAVTAQRAGLDTLDVAGAPRPAERIDLRYEASAASLIGEEAAPVETYWRGTDEARLLLQMSAANGRYRMTLVEALRSPYWQENIWSQLENVSARP